MSLQREVHSTSQLLLCSDGLSDFVSVSEVAEICLRNSRPTPLKLERLIDIAKQRGSTDNITAAFIAKSLS
jgi:serine/threonine protein phosphatase PrpC